MVAGPRLPCRRSSFDWHRSRETMRFLLVSPLLEALPARRSAFERARSDNRPAASRPNSREWRRSSPYPSPSRRRYRQAAGWRRQGGHSPEPTGCRSARHRRESSPRRKAAGPPESSRPPRSVRPDRLHGRSSASRGGFRRYRIRWRKSRRPYPGRSAVRQHVLQWRSARRGPVSALRPGMKPRRRICSASSLAEL